jgi:hypothetical protein
MVYSFSTQLVRTGRKQSGISSFDFTLRVSPLEIVQNADQPNSYEVYQDLSANHVIDVFYLLDYISKQPGCSRRALAKSLGLKLPNLNRLIVGNQKRNSKTHEAALTNYVKRHMPGKEWIVKIYFEANAK